MKTKFWNAIGRTGAAYLAATGALLIGTAEGLAQPFTTPGGMVWDCVLSGHRNGLAQLLFTAPDGATPGTLFAFELIVPKNEQATVTDRSISSDRDITDTRLGGSSTNSAGGSSSGSTNLFGAALFTGQWNFDVKGRIIGNLSESTAPVSCVTNTVVTSTVTTNGDTISVSYQTNTTVECSGGITNGYSFTASVSTSGRVPRLTLVSKGPDGPTTYRGVPSTQLPDASGSYYGDLIRSGHHNTEFLTLTPSSIGPFSVNIYSFAGSGPSYSYSDGIAVVSAWKKMGFEVITEPTNTVIRATVGSVNTNKFIAKTAGLEQASGESLPRVKFNVTRMP
jgi:hypothetical protein